MFQSVNFAWGAVTVEPSSRVPVADIVIVVATVEDADIEVGLVLSESFPSGV